MAEEGKAIDTASRVAPVARHVYGPRPIGALLPSLTRPAFRRQGPAAAQILADWPLIIGPELAAITQPRRLARGTLTIACSGPVAMELQHLAPELMARINAQLGAEPVQRLRFVQTVLRRVPLAGPTAPPSAAARRAAERAVGHLPAGELRDALAALGRAVLAHTTPSTRRDADR
jgi:hypothetical protein